MKMTVSEIRNRLRAEQGRTLAGWSAWRDEPYKTVWKTLNECAKHNRPPRGKSGKRIVTKLSDDLGVEFF